MFGFAGSASAAPVERVVDGPSVLEVEIDDAGELQLSYDNQSGRDLTCIATVTTEDLSAEIFGHFAFGDLDTPLPDYLAEMLDEAQEAGLMVGALFSVPAEGSGPVATAFSREYDFTGEWPVAVTRCSSVDYHEVEQAALHSSESVGVAVLDSPSVLTVTGRGTEATVQYENESGRGLYCVALVGEPTLISEIYSAVENDPASSGVLDEELRGALEEATRVGTVGTYGGVVDSGASMAFSPNPENVEPAGILTDDSFDPVGVSFCSLFAGEDTYTEVEISQTGPDDGGNDPTEYLPAPIVNGPSALAILPNPLLEGDFLYSYDNRSGMDLFCTVFLGSPDYIDEQVRRIDREELSVSEVTWLPSAAEGGEAGWFVSRAGTRGQVSTLPVPGPGTTETEPHAVSFCVDVELEGNDLVGIAGNYFEVETATFDSAGDDGNDDDSDTPGDGMDVSEIIAELLEAIDVFGSIGGDN